MMKFIKLIALGLGAVFFLGTICLLFLWWPIDSRLQGTFKSNSHETISRALQTNKNLNAKINLQYVKQLYDHSSLIFNGHREKQIIESHTYQKHDGTKVHIEGLTQESYFFMKNNGTDRAIVISIPSQEWFKGNISMFEMEFDNDGFWLISSDPLFSELKTEKFTRVQQPIN